MIRYVLIFCSFTILFSSCFEFPNYIKKCKLSDPKLNACLKEQGNKMISNNFAGDKNRQKLLPKVLLQPNNKFEIVFNNCDGIGFNAFKLDEIRMNQKYQTLQFSGLIEKFFWECTYKANGELLGRSFDDSGSINITFIDSPETYSADYDIKEINGISYYQVDNDIFKIKDTTISFNLTNTAGNYTQAKELNKILNEDSEYFSRKFVPKIEELSSVIVTEFINQVIGSIPADQLFYP